MKKHVTIIAMLSFFLLLCVLIGQIIWLIKIKEIKTNEFFKISSISLSQCVEEYLRNEMMDRKYGFGCGLRKDGKTFAYGNNKTIQISGLEEFDNIAQKVFYDHLCNIGGLNLTAVKKLYIVYLQKKGIENTPILEIQSLAGKKLFTTDSLSSTENLLTTEAIEVGYENRHRIVGHFSEPLFFYKLSWHLVCICIFFMGFCIALWWLWYLIKTDLKIAVVQTMGIAHLEHEIKKPLMALVSITKKMHSNLQTTLNAKELEHIEAIHGRLMNFQTVIDTMLFALKKEQLEITRKTIDLQQEIETTINIYKELKVEVAINYHIAENCKLVSLDNVYFGRMLNNLVDNGIKYNNNYPPEINIDFKQQGKYWVLTVTDNGIGIPDKNNKQVFKRFYRINDKRTAKRTGFGLGLAFVKQVVDAYKGNIEIENNKNGGSTFTIRLPME